MRTLAASLVVLVMLPGLACSDADPQAAPTATPDATVTETPASGPPGLVQPPSAYLKDASGTSREGGTGTYCWRQGNANVCADLFATRTHTTPIPVGAGDTLEFVFDAGTPREVHLSWELAEEWQSRPEADWLIWGPKDGGAYDGPQFTDSREAPREPGRYVLTVFTIFPEGDVQYGFYVEVR